MTVLDQLFFKQYDRHNYNCLHFLIDLWRMEFGIDMTFLLKSFIVQADGSIDMVPEGLDVFRRLHKPKSPCVCLCKTIATDDTHVATFYQDRMFHLTEDGVYNLPLEVSTLGFSRVLFYEYNKNN